MISEYTVRQALAELNISKATLYYRINKLKSKIEPHISMKNGKNFISREGIEILRVNDSSGCLPDSLDTSSDNHPDSSDNSSDSSIKNKHFSEHEKQDSNDAFNILKMENEFLKLQIKEKDNQIQTLSRLVENGQLLLKQEQDKNSILIEGEKMKKKWFWGIFSKE